MKKLNLDAIRIDGGTQPRERINMEVVQEYAEAIRSGVELPPVVVFFDGAERWLADGFHRWHAHKQAEKASIAADERAGSLLDALLYAVGANGTHGLPRSNADKRKAVEMVLTQDAWATWPETKIAEACRVSRTLVRAVMEERHLVEKQDAVRTVTRGGTTYKQDTSRIGKARPPAPPADTKKLAKVATVATYPQAGVESDSSQGAAQATADPKKTALPSAPAPERGQTLPPAEDFGPTDAELAAQAREQEEEAAALRRLLESDDKLAALASENQQLRAEIRVLKERRDGLMNENAELVKRIKALQRKLDKLEQAA